MVLQFKTELTRNKYISLGLSHKYSIYSWSKHYLVCWTQTKSKQHQTGSHAHIYVCNVLNTDCIQHTHKSLTNYPVLTSCTRLPCIVMRSSSKRFTSSLSSLFSDLKADTVSWISIKKYTITFIQVSNIINTVCGEVGCVRVRTCHNWCPKSSQAVCVWLASLSFSYKLTWHFMLQLYWLQLLGQSRFIFN